ncbi:MAG: pro-sigmaK processing inhibitor BofA family protein [Clostridia bacterium]|nr:pro-sigmaK processing inhibitor BofA family protein [Clostridia bacterium]
MVYVVFSFCALAILFFMYKSKHLIKSVFLSFLQGASALFAVNFLGGFLSVHLPVNLFTALCGAVGGIPGVIFLVVYDLFYKLP